ncbi:MAG: hypothetical protein AAF989_04380 [Planctomycetota bacterium]
MTCIVVFCVGFALIRWGSLPIESDPLEARELLSLFSGQHFGLGHGGGGNVGSGEKRQPGQAGLDDDFSDPVDHRTELGAVHWDDQLLLLAYDDSSPRDDEILMFWGGFVKVRKASGDFDAVPGGAIQCDVWHGNPLKQARTRIRFQDSPGRPRVWTWINHMAPPNGPDRPKDVSCSNLCSELEFAVNRGRNRGRETAL